MTRRQLWKGIPSPTPLLKAMGLSQLPWKRGHVGMTGPVLYPGPGAWGGEQRQADAEGQEVDSVVRKVPLLHGGVNLGVFRQSG